LLGGIGIISRDWLVRFNHRADADVGHLCRPWKTQCVQDNARNICRLEQQFWLIRHPLFRMKRLDARCRRPPWENAQYADVVAVDFISEAVRDCLESMLRRRIVTGVRTSRQTNARVDEDDLPARLFQQRQQQLGQKQRTEHIGGELAVERCDWSHLQFPVAYRTCAVNKDIESPEPMAHGLSEPLDVAFLCQIGQATVNVWRSRKQSGSHRVEFRSIPSS
jgi:hypothetical protein